MRRFMLCIIPLTGLALMGAMTSVQAVQDTPFTSNGITAVCTGVGSAKDNPEWGSYPVKIVLATSGGADLAAAHVTVTGGGKTLETDCDAPWVLIKAPAGKYTATATLVGGSGQSHSADFTTGASGGQKELTITFTAPRQQAAAQ